MKAKKTIITLIIIILLAGNVLLASYYLALQKEYQQQASTVESRQIDGKILAFAQMFVADVLQARSEIDFETRLKLENAVREIGDAEILAQWRKFTESQNEEEAQIEVKNLLEMLINKIE